MLALAKVTKKPLPPGGGFLFLIPADFGFWAAKRSGSKGIGRDSKIHPAESSVYGVRRFRLKPDYLSN
jgi:hypothetical protein